jgi:hypothetical protein
VHFEELDPDSIREAINQRQSFQALLEIEADLTRRFAGSMRYAERGGHTYLLRRRGKSRSDTSLGPKNPENDALLERFQVGKLERQGKVDGLRKQIEARRKLILAYGLGRMPTVSARILRQLNAVGWLGTKLVVVGTNALYAYEAAAGVRIMGGALATLDIDILHDVRRRVSLGGMGIPDKGLVGVLRQVDGSFSPLRPNGYRASNKDGFLVDLIEPFRGNRMLQKPSALSAHQDDMQAVSIEGLAWLVNAPKMEAVVFDERGLPLRMVTVDPRVFALHKAWLSQRADREPVKRRRDAIQATLAATLARDYLGLSFDASDLTALPAELRDASDSLAFDDQGDVGPW